MEDTTEALRESGSEVCPLNSTVIGCSPLETKDKKSVVSSDDDDDDSNIMPRKRTLNIIEEEDEEEDAGKSALSR